MPPSEPLDDLLYDTSTDIIKILTPNGNRMRDDWIIATSVIVVIIFMAICVGIGTWKCKVMHTAFIHVHNKSHRFEPINISETITHFNNQASDVDLAQSQGSPRFNITNSHMTLEEAIQISKAIDGSRSWTFESSRRQKPE